MKTSREFITYWDTSAIVSALFRDDRSDETMKFARSRATHLITSLAWAETQAVIARFERQRVLTTVLGDAAREALEDGPWRRLNLGPNWDHMARLARAWPLRGADLWHLATAKELHGEIPELTFLCYDNRLAIAARGEGLQTPM